MRRDHLADTVGIDDSHVTNERDEVVVEDVRLKGKVGDDENPGNEERKQADERLAWGFAALPSRRHDVQ